MEDVLHYKGFTAMNNAIATDKRLHKMMKTQGIVSVDTIHDGNGCKMITTKDPNDCHCKDPEWIIQRQI